MMIVERNSIPAHHQAAREPGPGNPYAAHASANARAGAPANSMVDKTAADESATREAPALEEAAARAAAIASARAGLAAVANKPVNESAFARVDALLGLSGPPTTQRAFSLSPTAAPLAIGPPAPAPGTPERIERDAIGLKPVEEPPRPASLRLFPAPGLG